MLENFETQFERVVGGTEGERARLKHELQEELLQIGDQDIAKYEIRLTEQDKTIIQNAEEFAYRMAKFYGGDPKPIPPHKIHFVRSGGASELTNGEFYGGIHRSLAQEIVVDRDLESNVDVATTLVHEMFHQLSYKAAQIDAQKKHRMYRSGIIVSDRESRIKHFSDIEEAIAEILAKKFYDEEMQNNPLYSEEIEATNKLKESLLHIVHRFNPTQEQNEREAMEEVYSIPSAREILTIFEKIEPDKETIATIVAEFPPKTKGRDVFVGRKNERDKLWRLIDEIIEKSHGRFENRQEVFDIFARANFSGNLIPLARLIESIFGKGSFRRLGEETADTGGTENK